MNLTTLFGSIFILSLTKLKDVIHLLYDEDILYRPPLEAESVLLEAAFGCNYAKCIFCECSSTHSKPIRVTPLAQVRKNASILASIDSERKKESAFLLGENALAFQTEYLKELFQYIHEFLPNVRRISMYARAVDVNNKSDRQLNELKQLGLGDLYIGLESGSDTVLQWCRKGETTHDMLTAFRRLDALGIPYSLSSIVGLGGKQYWKEHAQLTAELYNQIHPKSIRILTLTPVEGTQLYEEVRHGRFHPLTTQELLTEELAFLEQLEVQNCLFIGTHLTNTVPFTGRLSQQKQILIDMLTSVLQNFPFDSLSHPSASSFSDLDSHHIENAIS